ncbi:CAP domain-containing protein [Blautia wexlerae]|uniref:CAP domain-containing protein n=1 Tax=Blautia wexlerae TaxID=418240 RepID=UPI0032C0BF1D
MKRKRFSFLTLLVLAIMLLMPTSIQAAVKPGTVKLSSIKAVDYNKINIKWKKVSGATNYIVYYKKAGSGKWIKVKTLDNKKSSYTHTSSTKYPIVVGQKYQYTIKAYNKNTKKSGNYNKKGLTTRTIPATVYGLGAGLTGDNTVDVSWNPAGGTTHYVIYRKANDSTPSKIATISSKYTKYEDKNPVEGATNTYFVFGYSSKLKIYGNGSNTGVSIKVKRKVTPTPEPTSKPEKPGDDNNYGDNDDDFDDPVDPIAMASEVLRLTNIERAKEGAQPLKYNKTLQDAAMIRAKEISVKFSHERPNGTSYKTILGCVNGENIAMGYGDAESVVEGWMNSSGHKVTMLDNRYQYLGVGFYESDNGNYYWVQDFSTGNPDASGSITFDANGGTIKGNSTYTISGSPGEHVWLYDAPSPYTVANIPTPIKNGYFFSGWFQLKNPDDTWNPIRRISYAVGGTTLYAKWTPNN